jgi:hypothetical protein
MGAEIVACENTIEQSEGATGIGKRDNKRSTADQASINTPSSLRMRAAAKRTRRRIMNATGRNRLQRFIESIGQRTRSGRFPNKTRGRALR